MPKHPWQAVPLRQQRQQIETHVSCLRQGAKDALIELRQRVAELKRNTLPRERDHSDTDEVDIIHRTLNVILAEIDDRLTSLDT